MASHISHTSYDHIPACIVPVIASFDSQGCVKPLYVRIAGETLKLHSSWLKPAQPGIIVFHCQAEDHGQYKLLTLTFHPRELVWTISEKQS